MNTIGCRQWQYSTITETFTIDLSYDIEGDRISAAWLDVTQKNPDEPWVLEVVEGVAPYVDNQIGPSEVTRREQLDANASLHYILGTGAMYAISYDEQRQDAS